MRHHPIAMYSPCLRLKFASTTPPGLRWQELIKPVSDDLKEHLGYHDGHRFTLALVIPLICVLITGSAILIAAFV